MAAHQDSADAHYLLGYIFFKEANPKLSLTEYTVAARYREPSALDLEVIAEGVETAEQLAFLREENCDRVQGFYFSQAVPLAALESYIIRGSATAALRSEGRRLP